MNIENAPPPNFDTIIKVFPRAVDPGVLFCYGETIFNPSGIYIPPNLIAHEEVHSKRQEVIGPELWWRKYLIDPAFRLEEELPAHIVEYHEFVKTTKNRQLRRSYLDAVASRLSGPLYCNLVSKQQAVELIVNAPKLTL